MKLVVDIPKGELEFFREFIKRLKGAKSEEINGDNGHVLLSKKQYDQLCEQLEMQDDVKAFRKAISQDKGDRISVADYRKQRAKKKRA